LLLFAIVFFWTPPHFWALALLIRRDYEAAGVPMLPVVRGERETTKQIVLYSGVLVAVTASPFLWGTLGVPYLVAALVLGAVFSFSRSACAASPLLAAPRCSSTSRSSTWRCSSQRWPWTPRYDRAPPGADTSADDGRACRSGRRAGKAKRDLRPRALSASSCSSTAPRSSSRTSISPSTEAIFITPVESPPPGTRWPSRTCSTRPG
jgi:hypothetical protein